MFAAKPVRILTPTDLRELREGDVFIDGRFLDPDGEEIPDVPDEKVEEIREAIECGEITDTAEVKAIAEGEKPLPRQTGSADRTAPSTDAATRENGASHTS
ncbi:hypothetical protein [Brevibacterium otitidis]|uniref:Uncharacterized protein n=1 Tax=Brevibacterium otitidis TaxID=53364 RepID=A0ABV5WYF6_9MICO|nr:hypothetical protein GCM10023233_00360 [Brevibacterium otitidis]BFF08602.1 hypothetical protein GCM10023233_35710 [Brevibacterium otitidis]